MRREDLAWAAGFFDGEGTTISGTFYKPNRLNPQKKYHTINLIVTQKNPELLHKFKDIVGVGKVYGPDSRGIHRYKVTSFPNTQHVVAILWSWLGNDKKEQASRALLKYRS